MGTYILNANVKYPYAVMLIFCKGILNKSAPIILVSMAAKERISAPCRKLCLLRFGKTTPTLSLIFAIDAGYYTPQIAIVQEGNQRIAAFHKQYAQYPCTGSRLYSIKRVR